MKKIVFFFLFIFAFADEHLFLSNFQNLKKFYYNHQIVHLKLKTISAKNGDLIIKSNYLIEVNTSTDDNVTYFSNISFELNNTFPEFNISLENNGIKLDEIAINVNSEVRNLTPPKNFCGVLAKDVNITNPVLSDYNSDLNILYFNIAFNDANEKEFSFYKKVELSLKDKNGSASLYSYSALVPKNKNNFIISYFNILDNSYKNIPINVKLDNEKVSTQIDLNPVNKTRTYIINAIISTLILLWLLLYYYKRKVTYIILILIALGALLFLNWPKPEIILQEGKKVHILPFKNSTTFLIVNIPTKVKVLNERNGYKQILINNKIGWVKDDRQN
jgi:hypothetical protein